MSDGINDGHAYFEGAPIASERPADPAGETKNPGGLLGILRKRALECQGLSIEAMQIQPALVIELCATVATLRAQVARLAEATRLVDFYRDTHGCEDSDICTGCAAATLFLKQTRAQSTPPSPAPEAVRRLTVALTEAAMSLQTIDEQAGREPDLMHWDQVRGYAHSRARVARTALAESAGKGE